MSIIAELAQSNPNILPSSLVPELTGPLDFLRNAGARKLKEGSLAGSSQKIEIGFLNSRWLSAKSGTYKGVDFVLIGRHNYTILLGFFWALLSHGIIFPETISGIFVDRPVVFPNEIKMIPNMLYDWRDIEALSDPLRDTLANNLALGALLSCFFHEMAHIDNGHTSWIINNQNASSLSLQTLEFDADVCAADEMLRSSLYPEIDISHSPNRWQLPETNGFGTWKEAVAAVGLISFAQFLWEKGEWSNANEMLYTAKHPPRASRISYTIKQITHVLNVRCQMNVVDIEYVLSTIVNQLDQTLNALVPGNTWTSYTEEQEEIGISLFIEYEKEWERLHPELDLLKRKGTLAPARAPQ